MSPPLAVTLPDGSRRYCHPLTAEVVPSVTSVLRVINKPNVIRWAAKKSDEYTAAHWEELKDLPMPERVERISGAHEQVSGAARELGTSIHETIDSWQKGAAAEDPEGAGPYLNRFIDWVLDTQPTFIENETTVWSHTHGYAGTLDFIAKVNNRIVLGDIKTGKGVYGEASLQLAALAGADTIIREDGTEEEIPQVEELAVLHLRPRSCKLLRASDREKNFKTFLAARQIVRWQEEVAPNVFLGG